MVKWVRASSRACKFLLFNYFLVLICVIIVSSTNWYVITPTKCESKIIVVNGESYTATSRTTNYIKLYSGLCSDQYSNDNCISWDDSSYWKNLDNTNKIVSDYNTNFSYDAEYTWPVTFRVGIVCLILVFLVVILLLYAIIIGNMTWEYQMSVVFIQFVLIILIWIHLVLGLITDTILPTSWKTYYLGCDIYTGPGAAWWSAIIGVVICLYSSVLLLFPYLMGPLWVNHIANVSIISPSFELDIPDNDHDEEDPYQGIEFHQ
mmetsp:Transcript_13911/g.14509  ORF Transcript_13911/g.14509 Transcript_13911/m.14509 type:complete len:262 (+) Transcript_13911:28-813(+)